MKCANHVKFSQIVAIIKNDDRTTFYTNYFWNKSKYCVYLLFLPSLLLHFFFFGFFFLLTLNLMLFTHFIFRSVYHETLPNNQNNPNYMHNK